MGGKRVIITGGTGFVGSNLAHRLLKDGHEVYLLASPSHDGWRIENIRNDIRIHMLDLADKDMVKNAVAEIRPEWVFHFAVYGAYSWQTDPQRMVSTNICGTMNLVRACAGSGIEVFINTGTSSEYGFKDHPPSENEALEPNSDYAVTKASATLFCGYAARSLGMRVITLRLYSAYGPYEEPARLIPTLIIYGLEKKLPPLVDPEVKHDFIYMKDIEEVYLRVAASAKSVGDNGAVYNVGSGIQIPMNEVVRTVRDLMKIKEEPKWGSMQNRRWDTNIWVANRSKIEAELGWHPRYNFEEGLRDAIEWFSKTPGVIDFYRKRLKRI